MRFSAIKRAAAFFGIFLAASAWAAAPTWRDFETAAESAVSVRDWPKARLYYKLGLRFAVGVSDKEAVRHLRTQIKRLPVDPAVIGQLLADERYDEAFKRLKEYLNYNPGDVWAMSLMGYVYQAIDQNGKAEKLYKKAVATQKGHPTPHYYYGQYLLLKKKKFEDALAEFKTFRERLAAPSGSSPAEKRSLERERIQATRWIVSILDTTLGRPREAMDEMRTLVRAMPNDPETQYDYGALAARLGWKETAYGAFKKVIKLAPGTALADRAKLAIGVVQNTDNSGNPYVDPYS